MTLLIHPPFRSVLVSIFSSCIKVNVLLFQMCNLMCLFIKFIPFNMMTFSQAREHVIPFFNIHLRRFIFKRCNKQNDLLGAESPQSIETRPLTMFSFQFHLEYNFVCWTQLQSSTSLNWLKMVATPFGLSKSTQYIKKN